MQRAVIIASSGFGQVAMANLLRNTEFDVVATASPSGGIRGGVARWRPDVVLIDLGQGTDLVEVLELVRDADPSAAAVVLADTDDTDLVVPALEHGARGLLSRHRSSAELQHSLRTVAGGEIVIDPRLAPPLAAFVTRGVHVAGPYGLSRAEEVVVAHLPQELTNQQIGRRLGISTSTVKTHLQHAFPKLGVRDRIEAALIAVELGLA